MQSVQLNGLSIIDEDIFFLGDTKKDWSHGNLAVHLSRPGIIEESRTLYPDTSLPIAVQHESCPYANQT